MLNIKNRFKLNVKISKKYTFIGKKVQNIINAIIYDYFKELLFLNTSTLSILSENKNN